LQYTASTTNPFGVLTAVVAPAILTNASSVLALGTSNRLARVVDRTRVVAATLAGIDPASPAYESWSSQLGQLQVRAQLLVKALGMFYAGLGLFSASALVSVGGSIAAYYDRRPLFEIAAAVAIVTGASAVIGLVSGCYLMVRETQRAVHNLDQEARLQIKRDAAKDAHPRSDRE